MTRERERERDMERPMATSIFSIQKYSKTETDRESERERERESSFPWLLITSNKEIGSESSGSSRYMCLTVSYPNKSPETKRVPCSISNQKESGQGRLQNYPERFPRCFK